MKKIDLSIPKNRIIVALDVSTIKEIIFWVTLLKDCVGFFKIGFQLIHSVGGPQAIKAVKENGGRVFYDCKLYDIPDTMKLAAIEIAKQDVEIFNIHASSTIKAMKLVQEVCGESIIAGVSVLTSFSEEECFDVYNKTLESKVIKFARDMVHAGIPAIISSPSEVVAIKNLVGTTDLITITPGVRPIWSLNNDQNPDRVMTPKKAILAGSDMLVIGRPILQPPVKFGNSIDAVKLITVEIEEALILMSF